MITYNPVQGQPVRFKQVLRLPCILPPPGNLRIANLISVVYKIIVCIGDFKLSPCTRLNVIYGLKYSGVININAGYGKLTLRVRWLFLYTHDPAIPDLRHAKTLRVMNL